MRRHRLVEEALRRSPEYGEYLGRGGCELLTRPNEERYVRPAPGIHVEAQGSVRLGVGMRRDSFFGAVAFVLAADDVTPCRRQDGSEDFDFFVAHRLGVRSDRRLHGQDREDLQQVILHDVPQRPEFLIQPAAATHAERFGHRDLHVLDMRAIPDRFDE